MLKPFIAITLVFLIFTSALAQKRDTLMYYFQKPWKLVSTKDSAEFIIVVFPPDTNVDKYMFIVKGFYPDGKLMSVGGSNTARPLFKYQGTYMTFFHNGRRKATGKFENGIQFGDEVEYYPNGKLCSIITLTYDNKRLLEEFRDSTGTVLTKNGNGKWVYFSDDQNSIPRIEGQVVNGLAQGEWLGKQNDTTCILTNYKDGIEKSTVEIYKSGRVVYVFSEIGPEFRGGSQRLYKFLENNIKYPPDARRHNTQGYVIVQFTVEVNGTLSDLKIFRGIGDGCDEEVLRVMKLSPKWKPAMEDGKQVASRYNVPVKFTLK